MKFKIIACINDKLALGNNGQLLYSIKADLANFKRITTGGVVIMGRKTFESLPNQEPLKERVNIVITQNMDYNLPVEYENINIVHSVEEAVELCEALYSDKECYVIGGSSLYSQFLSLDLVDTMYITKVNDDTEGDTYFPNVFDEWYEFYKSYTQRQRSDEVTYRFIIYKK